MLLNQRPAGLAPAGAFFHFTTSGASALLRLGRLEVDRNTVVADNRICVELQAATSTDVECRSQASALGSFIAGEDGVGNDDRTTVTVDSATILAGLIGCEVHLVNAQPRL